MIDPEDVREYTIRQLREGSLAEAKRLGGIAMDVSRDVDDRASALDVLVSARASVLQSYVGIVVRHALGSSDPTMRFAAIAAASDLDAARRAEIEPLIIRIAQEPDVRGAAEAFLREEARRRNRPGIAC